MSASTASASPSTTTEIPDAAERFTARTSPPPRSPPRTGTGRPAGRGQPVAAVDQDARVAGERRRVARHRDDLAPPSTSPASPPAPWRPPPAGRRRPRRTRSSSAGDSGLAKRSRRRAVTGLRPVALPRRRFERGDQRRVAFDRGDRRRVAARRSVKVPMPAKRSATGAASPTWASTASASAASAARDACTKPPGGGKSDAPAGGDLGRPVAEDLDAVDGQPRERRVGAEAAERGQRPRVRLAGAGDGDVEAVVGGEHGDPRRLPRLQRDRRRSRGASAASSTIAGASTGHSSMATISLRCRGGGSRGRRPSPSATAEKTARRRLPGAIGTTGSTGASMPRCAKASRRPARASRRDRRRAPCAASAQPPQVPKWRQTGATRSALARDDAEQPAAVAAPLDLDRLAGQREGHEDAARRRSRRCRRRRGRARRS